MDEIVRRLLSNNSKSVSFLKESMSSRINEDDDEETIRRKRDSNEDEELDKDTDELEDELYKDDDEKESHRGSSRHSTEREEHHSSDRIAINPPKLIAKKSVNPLDNPYAVEFKLGDKVVLTYSNGSSTDLEAEVEGYDKEGFYRIRFNSGMTINGLTDIALSGITKEIKESICLCGNKKFIDENNNLVCDKCGRIIKENLAGIEKLEKEEGRGKGKRMIRSEMHPMSTSIKPNIAVNESDSDEDVDFLDTLSTLAGKFWTQDNEMIDDIRDLGFEVEECTAEYVLITSDDEEEIQIPLVRASRTVSLNVREAEVL